MENKQIIGEFIQALDFEIDAIKNRKDSKFIRLFNGSYIQKVGEYFIYKFHLENFFSSIEDSSAQIEINGKDYEAHIYLVKGLEAEIGINFNLGDKIQEAKLFADLSFLLELLKKRFSAYLEKPGAKDFSLSQLLFTNIGLEKNTYHDVVQCKKCGKKNRINKDLLEKTHICHTCKADLFKYVNVEKRLNPSQRKAVLASLLSKISFIWGPPGTGKTQTIASSTECQLNFGHRILLVSHSNNAVDEALEKIAHQLRNSEFYKDGQIVRLGKPQEKFYNNFIENYEMLLPDKIVEKKSKDLLFEKDQIQEDITQKKASIFEIDRILEINEKSISIKEKIQKLIDTVFSLEKKKKQNTENILHLKKKISFEIKHLAKVNSSSKVIRFLTKQSPEKMKLKIKALEEDKNQSILNGTEIDNLIIKNQEHLQKEEIEYRGIVKPVDNFLKKENTTIEGLLKKRKTLEDYVKSGNERLSEIDNILSELKKNVIKNARLIGTTLTKTFSDKSISEESFDVLIVDESSMATLPYVYWAIGKVKKSVIIVGDFMQIPPICMARDNPITKKWLEQNIYSLLQIDTVDKAIINQTINLLKIQYRMVPEISKIANTFFYQNNLQDDPSSEKQRITSELSDNPLVLVDSTNMNPWACQPTYGSRFNLYHALLVIEIIKRLQKTKKVDIGVITPYAAQAKTINKIAADEGLLDSVKISTVHKFQGGEEQIIIFDTTEGDGLRIAPMLDDQKEPNAKLLLNVAMTRAQSQFIMIGHTKKLIKGLSANSKLKELITYFTQNADSIASENLIDGFLTEDFEKWNERMISSQYGDKINVEETSVFNERSFWPAFLNDIRKAKKSIYILSPFISERRSSKIMPHLFNLLRDEVKIKFFIQPGREQARPVITEFNSLINAILKVNIKIVEINKMHQKIVIIDEKVIWEGSLNVLSHRDTKEHMRRFESIKGAEEIINNLNLDDNHSIGTHTESQCDGSHKMPNCDGHMVIRTPWKKRNKFLGCSNYPDCENTVSFTEYIESEYEDNPECPKCGKELVKRYSMKTKQHFFGCSGYPDCKYIL